MKPRTTAPDPTEVLFRSQQDSTFFLECTTKIKFMLKHRLNILFGLKRLY